MKVLTGQLPHQAVLIRPIRVLFLDGMSNFLDKIAVTTGNIWISFLLHYIAIGGF